MRCSMFVERFMNGKETQPLKRKKILTGVFIWFLLMGKFLFSVR